MLKVDNILLLCRMLITNLMNNKGVGNFLIFFKRELNQYKKKKKKERVFFF